MMTLQGRPCSVFQWKTRAQQHDLFKDFAKDERQVRGKGTVRQWTAAGCSELDVLAKLPTRDQALSMLMRNDEGADDQAGTDHERGTWQVGTYTCSGSRSEGSRRRKSRCCSQTIYT